MNSTVLNFLCWTTVVALVGGVVLAAMHIPAAEWAWLPTTVSTGFGALAGVARQGEQRAELEAAK